MISYDKHLPYQVIKSYQDEYPNVLKTRCCITTLENTKDWKHLGLIWFDDGDKDPRETLKEHLNDVKWDELGEEFDY